ncbi:MAG TPA: hypothetical protein VFB38_20590 [Chthonomonadaceae bacterium]|nr:hypothetical protein [Chthonomonadaceae bacterium]
MPLNRREDILYFTRKNPFDRFPDGRPHVPDNLLERMRHVTAEEAWGVMARHGYHHQFEGGWFNVHPEKVMVGRAVTAKFVPSRPDLHEAIEEWGAQNGGVGGQNSWVIDTLVENDVVVVDLFGKIEAGTFAGDNLGTAIARRTKAGMVIDGSIRDLARLQQIPNLGIFARGVDVAGISGVTLVGLNCPIEIGKATVLPGDVVLGTCSGVTFIPPHLVEEVVESSERIRLQDEWGQEQIRAGRYSPGEVDRAWNDQMKAEFEEWRRMRAG